DPVGEPRSPARNAPGTVLGGVAGVGCQTPISPRIAELGRKFGMDLEASPRQLIDRGAAAPVERQEASRFAGGRASDLVTFYEDRRRAPSACEVGDRGADRAAAADHDALARAHTVVPIGHPARCACQPVDAAVGSREDYAIAV